MNCVLEMGGTYVSVPILKSTWVCAHAYKYSIRPIKSHFPRVAGGALTAGSDTATLPSALSALT